MLLGILSGTSTGDRSWGDVAGRRWTLNVRIDSSITPGRFGHLESLARAAARALEPPATFMASCEERVFLAFELLSYLSFRPTGCFWTGGQCFVCRATTSFQNHLHSHYRGLSRQVRSRFLLPRGLFSVNNL